MRVSVTHARSPRTASASNSPKRARPRARDDPEPAAGVVGSTGRVQHRGSTSPGPRWRLPDDRREALRVAPPLAAASTKDSSRRLTWQSARATATNSARPHRPGQSSPHHSRGRVDGDAHRYTGPGLEHEPPLPCGRRWMSKKRSALTTHGSTSPALVVCARMIASSWVPSARPARTAPPEHCLNTLQSERLGEATLAVRRRRRPASRASCTTIRRRSGVCDG